jgi:hypothetical protein
MVGINRGFVDIEIRYQHTISIAKWIKYKDSSIITCNNQKLVWIFSIYRRKQLGNELFGKQFHAADSDYSCDS